MSSVTRRHWPISTSFFDPSDPSPEREHQVEEALLAELPGVPWEATNQASVHVWFPEKFGYEVKPFRTTAEAVATWPETATSVGLRLEEDDDLVIVAPLVLTTCSALCIASTPHGSVSRSTSVALPRSESPSAGRGRRLCRQADYVRKVRRSITLKSSACK
jgi:hypothetical protein